MEIFKSTTNTVTIIVVAVTAIIVVASLFADTNEIPALVWGSWAGIIGWVVGAKSSKGKYEGIKLEKEAQEVAIPQEVLDALSK